MRNLSRKAAIHAAIVVIGIVLLWIGIQYQEAIGKGAVSGLLVAAGILAAFFATIFLLRVLFLIRGMARLKSGTEVVTRWHVNASDWDRFREADQARALSNLQFLVNDLTVRKQTPVEGVEIIVGEHALIADGSYHVLRINGLPELRNIGWLDNSKTAGNPPDCLEFMLAYAGGRSGVTQYTCLRVPVPGHAREQGMQAYRHFAPAIAAKRERGAIAFRNPRRTLQVCGAVLAIGIVAIASGFMLGWAGVQEGALYPLVLILVGIMLAFLALVLGGITLLMSRGSK